MSGMNVALIGRIWETVLEREQRRIVFHDVAAGRHIEVTPAQAAAPDALLPAFVVAGEAVWRELTGKGFELDVERDQQALLGYRLRGIGAGNFATVMLATMEAAARVAGPRTIVVNELGAMWSDAMERAVRLSGAARERSASNPVAEASP